MPERKEPENEKEKQPEIKLDLGLGGIFKDLGTLVGKLSELADKGEQLRELRDIAGLKGSRAIIGYNVRTLGGRPVVRAFGNVRETEHGPVVQEKREPLIDIFNENGKVKVVAELPGVDEKDIKLDLEGNKLTISVDTEGRKYYKEVAVPSPAKLAASSYKNGVLEVRLSELEVNK